LAGIRNCPFRDEADLRRTVYVTGEADTYFTVPAVCKIEGKRVKGFLTCGEPGYLFTRSKKQDD
jgi:hypothetical protein